MQSLDGSPPANLQFYRSRPGVRIHLLPAHIADIVCQPEVLAAFSVEELCGIAEVVQRELKERGGA